LGRSVRPPAPLGDHFHRWVALESPAIAPRGQDSNLRPTAPEGGARRLRHRPLPQLTTVGYLLHALSGEPEKLSGVAGREPGAQHRLDRVLGCLGGGPLRFFRALALAE
jgi:hypothetical protein